MRLVGEKVLLDITLKADSFRNFASNGDNMNKMKIGLPILLAEAGIIRGVPKTEQEWFTFLEKLLAIKPVASGAE
jgi:hypothetical protein